MPAVSVLLPCYNAAETLEAALASLRAQTLADFEIIAVDDGSTDETLTILKKWAKADERIHIVQRPHGGIVTALNAGLVECQAEYVARMDADDLSRPERLELQAQFLDAHPEVSVASCLVNGYPPEDIREGFQIYIEWLNSLVTDEDIRRELFIESPVAHPSVMFRKAAVTAVDGYQDFGWAEDYDLWLRLYLNGARFGKLPQTLLDWRDQPERLTRRDPRYSLENFIRAKTHYLILGRQTDRGPLAGRDAVIVWGAGMHGRRISKYLLRDGVPLAAFVDIDPKKIGRTRRGKPIIAPEELLGWWDKFEHPVILAAVGARGAREIIRQRLTELGLAEGRDWWGVA